MKGLMEWSSDIRRVAMIMLHSHPLADPGSGDAGGMTVYVREIARSLAARGISIDIYTRIDCPCRQVETELFPGVSVIQLPAGPPSTPKEDLPDHIGEFTAGMLDWIASNELCYDLIHSHYWLSGGVATEVSSRLGVPFVHTFHTLGRAKNASLRSLDDPEPDSRLAGEARVIGAADAIVASTPEERRWLIELYQASPERIHLILPGVDHDSFKPAHKEVAKARLGLSGKKTLLFVGRLQPLKAADTAIRAIGKLVEDRRIAPDQARLLIIGGASGESGNGEPARLQALAMELGVESSVVLLPSQPHQSLPAFFQAADVSLVPSYTETFGLVALEAQASGVPVVASAVGGLRTIVCDGATGYLVNPGSPEEFADAAWKILSDPHLAKRMSVEAVRHSAGLSWERSAEQLHGLYSLCLAPELPTEEPANKPLRTRRKVSPCY